jgi:hypothetical protein
MNILDEDIDFHQRTPLEAWSIHVRQIGVEMGRSGMIVRRLFPGFILSAVQLFSVVTKASMIQNCGTRDTV